jgi:hypothetical protein
MKHRIKISLGEVEIGGCPICGPDRLREIAPELVAAQEKVATDPEAVGELGFQIVRYFGNKISRDLFLCDLYDLKLILKVWQGDYEAPSNPSSGS